MIVDAAPIDAVGARLVVPVRLSAGRISKGTTVDAELAARLADAGIERLCVDRARADDVDENAAAALVAAALAGSDVARVDTRTGRANLRAARDGIVRVAGDRVTEANLVHEGVAISTVPDGTRVRDGARIATVKIVPWSLARSVIRSVRDELPGGAVSVVRERALRIALVCAVPGGDASGDRAFVDRCERVLAARLEPLGETLALVHRVSHVDGAIRRGLDLAVRGHGADLVLLVGPRSVTGRQDAAALAVERAGGTIVRHGMPVEPGNLMLFARLGRAWVLGLPSCARSTAANGLDAVLDRLAAGREPDARWLAGLGVGGLLRP